MNRVTERLEITASHARIVLTARDDGIINVSVLADLTDRHQGLLESYDTMQFLSTEGSTWVTFSAQAHRQET